MHARIRYTGKANSLNTIIVNAMEEHNNYYGQPCGWSEGSGARFKSDKGWGSFSWVASMDYKTSQYRKEEQDQWVEEQVTALKGGEQLYRAVQWNTSRSNRLTAWVAKNGKDLIVEVKGWRYGIPWWLMPDNMDISDGIFIYHEAHRDDLDPWEVSEDSHKPENLIQSTYSIKN